MCVPTFASLALRGCVRCCPGCWAPAGTLRELPVSGTRTPTVPTQCGQWCSGNKEGRPRLSPGPAEHSRSSTKLKLVGREEVREQKAGKPGKTQAPPPSPCTLHSVSSAAEWPSVTEHTGLLGQPSRTGTDFRAPTVAHGGAHQGTAASYSAELVARPRKL